MPEQVGDVFDAVPPRQYPSWEAYKGDWEALFAVYPGPTSDKISELSITVLGSVAYGHNIQTGDQSTRPTSRLRRIAGGSQEWRHNTAARSFG